MRLTLSITKSLEENAALCYERAKKLKKKIERAQQIVAEIKTRINQLALQKAEEEKKADIEHIPRKKEWYEKFHWLWTSTGFFVIGGRDATTNELVIKKHTDKQDLVFHTEMAGSPFFVIKTEGKPVNGETIAEVATATACYSRAWKLGMSMAEVFRVKPEQVTKTAETGEYVPKGSFVIRGKKEHIVVADFSLAIGKKDRRVIGGPVSAIAAHTKEYVIVQQGKEKQSDIAKKIAKRLGVDIDDVAPFLPAGGAQLKKEK